MKNYESFQTRLSKEQAAIRLGYSLRSLERAMRARQIKYCKVGNRNHQPNSAYERRAEKKQ